MALLSARLFQLELTLAGTPLDESERRGKELHGRTDIAIMA